MSVASDSLVDCSAPAAGQNGDTAVTTNIAEDCTAATQHSKTGKVVVCAVYSGGSQDLSSLSQDVFCLGCVFGHNISVSK